VTRSVADGLDVLTSRGASSRAGGLIARGRLESLIRVVDGVVVVVRSRSTPRALVDRLPEAAPNLLGVVVSDLRRTSLPDYFGDYFAARETMRPAPFDIDTASRPEAAWMAPGDLEAITENRT
jgi:hypothetical protein